MRGVNEQNVVGGEVLVSLGIASLNSLPDNPGSAAFKPRVLEWLDAKMLAAIVGARFPICGDRLLGHERRVATADLHDSRRPEPANQAVVDLGVAIFKQSVAVVEVSSGVPRVGKRSQFALVVE